jgi:hypothetical protein
MCICDFFKSSKLIYINLIMINRLNIWFVFLISIYNFMKFITFFKYEFHCKTIDTLLKIYVYSNFFWRKINSFHSLNFLIFLIFRISYKFTFSFLIVKTYIVYICICNIYNICFVYTKHI